MAKGSSKRRSIVPEAHKALDALKYEIAAELGIFGGGSGAGDASFGAEFAGELGEPAGAAGAGVAQGAAYGGGTGREAYWGHVATRDAGAVGGRMTRELIRRAQLALG